MATLSAGPYGGSLAMNELKQVLRAVLQRPRWDPEEDDTILFLRRTKDSAERRTEQLQERYPERVFPIADFVRKPR